MSVDCQRREPPSGADALAAGIEAARRGCLPEAVENFDQALLWALEEGSQELVDRIRCNRCAVEFFRGEFEQPRRELRRILLRSSDSQNCFFAAYNIARSYDLQKDYERAMFYARIARQRCLSLDHPEWLAWSHNQTGNLQLGMSCFDEACEEFELALALVSAEPSIERAIVLDNLGYCRLVQGRHAEGFSHLYESLRSFRRFGAERFEVGPRLALCFGYLEVGKQRYALRHAEVALELAEKLGEVEAIKYSYFLLGETHKQMHRTDIALDYFTRLQQTYYPEAAHVPEFLLFMDVRQIVNLKG